MNNSVFLVAGGNPTALVSGCPPAKRGAVAKKLLERVEQVGFVCVKNGKPALEMMGGELCVNASLAMAARLSHMRRLRGEFYASGVDGLVHYSCKGNMVSVRMPLKFSKKGNYVVFKGIGFLVSKKSTGKISRASLARLSRAYGVPAFGAIYYKKNAIFPVVYVAAVDSLMEETACGSGSIAFCIAKGINKVIQPTGEIISIKTGPTITITAKVIGVPGR
ncbi:MAG: hypothetical protein NTY90_05255 [Candidatus Micrarchaeota archaeon]|nr:hypothetical protein [Candidatus Micrarchaeota archaeon]